MLKKPKPKNSSSGSGGDNATAVFGADGKECEAIRVKPGAAIAGSVVSVADKTGCEDATAGSVNLAGADVHPSAGDHVGNGDHACAGDLVGDGAKASVDLVKPKAGSVDTRAGVGSRVNIDGTQATRNGSTSLKGGFADATVGCVNADAGSGPVAARSSASFETSNGRCAATESETFKQSRKWSLHQRYYEYVKYYSSFPKLIASDKSKLRAKIEEILGFVDLKDMKLSDVNFNRCSGTPILDKYSISHGMSLK